MEGIENAKIPLLFFIWAKSNLMLEGTQQCSYAHTYIL